MEPLAAATDPHHLSSPCCLSPARVDIKFVIFFEVAYNNACSSKFGVMSYERVISTVSMNE